MDPLAKLMLNGLKCPVCQGRIDFYDGAIRSFNFCCSSNWEHYQLWFEHWKPVLNIEYEQAIVYDSGYKYIAYQSNDKDTTDIAVYKIDPEGNLIGGGINPKHFYYDKKLFDFSKTTREKLLNRVKTILVFQ